MKTVEQEQAEAETMQHEMHRHVEMVVKANPKVSYQDAANVFLLLQLAKLKGRIQELEWELFSRQPSK